MKAAAFIQARMGSKRLPGKVLLPLGKTPLLSVLIDRVKACPEIDQVIVSTSPGKEDDALAQFCQEQKIPCSRFAVDDIIGRLHAALTKAGNVDYIVRFWGDSPFVCPELITAGLKKVAKEDAAFFSTGYPTLTYPGGIDFEIYRPELIEEIHGKSTDPFFREFPFEYVKAHPEIKRTGMPNSQDLHEIELSVDYPEDLEVAQKLYSDLKGASRVFSFKEITAYTEKHPELFERNVHLSRNIEYKQKLKSREK